MAPASAFITELLKKEDKNLRIVFVGRRYPHDSEKTLSLEYREMTKKGIKFIPLKTGRFTRMISVRTLQNVYLLILGIFRAFKIVQKEQPNLIFSFGSYLAAPVVFWAALFRIPIFIHEQTIHPGASNRLSAYFARKIFLAFDEAKKFFPKNKCIVTGNPVRPAIFSVINKPFNLKKDKPAIYITGGSLGSHSINEHIQKILPRLLKKYIVIHQTGSSREFHDFENLKIEVSRLSPELQQNYYSAKHFLEEEIGYVYSQADLVISRAGANTFFELIALEKPAILIPLPWSAGFEQIKHAQIFADAKTGIIFHQTENSERLLQQIDKMIKELDSYRKNFITLHNLYKKNAAEFMVSEIFKSF